MIKSRTALLTCYQLRLSIWLLNSQIIFLKTILCPTLICLELFGQVDQVDVDILHRYYNYKYYSPNNSNVYTFIDTMLQVQSELDKIKFNKKNVLLMFSEKTQ